MSWLEAVEVRKRFEREGREIVAIDCFSLSVPEGEFVTIVGPSGCGKSTFLHMVGGFEPIAEGSISLAGDPVRGPGPDRGMLFQDYALFPWLSVIGNVAWALEAKGLPKTERARLARTYLDRVGLSAFADAYPSELSGGMQQRVALARVLALEPRMLLMDEPFGALDAQTRELMQEELTAIWQRDRRTVLFVTHDIDEAVYLSDRVVVFSARPGRLKADIRINLPRPREPGLRKTADYAHLRNQIWDLLRDEVLAARKGV